MTWALVTTWPSVSQMVPLPAPCGTFSIRSSVNWSRLHRALPPQARPAAGSTQCIGAQMNSADAFCSAQLQHSP